MVSKKELKICILCRELKAMGKNRKTCSNICAKKYRLLEYKQREALINGISK